MSYLLDTHALLWWLFNDRRLSRRARTLLGNSGNRIAVSAASGWEIATKHRLGRLDSAAPLLQDFSAWMLKAGFAELPITSSHAVQAGSWDVPHRDPFDRMLAAQSAIEDLRLISRDPVFTDFGLDPAW